MSRFFVSCALGFEQALQSEIKEFWFEMIDLDGLPTRAAFPEIELLTGGLELDVADHLGYQINFFSKLANRVLIRHNKFEARYFDQFEKGLAKIEFEKVLDFVTLKNQVQLKFESHKSRLNNEKNLLEAAGNVFKKKNIKVVDKATQTIFIRIDKDRVTVSLDTSGEHLHKRGYANFRGEAPLRETLAAYLVTTLKSYVNLDSELSLIDPFVGSGTLLFEAISKNLPNLNRDYSWLHFKSAPKLFKSDSWKKNYRWFANTSSLHCLGFDLDEKSIANIKNNERQFKQIFELESINLSYLRQDSALLNIDRIKLRKKVWLLANPPYGIRLADDQAKQILEKFDESVDGIVVIHPEKWNFHFKKLKPIHVQDFSNQGINLKLSVFFK